MAAEPNSPQTGTIAFFTVASLILILVSFVTLQGLFHVWENRYSDRVGEGEMPSDLTLYQKEQNAKLDKIKESMQQVLADAKAGKNLAAPAPATPPAPTK